MQYPVDIVKDTNDTYWLSSPFFPGLNAVGDTVEEAKTNGVAALYLLASSMMDDWKEIPEPPTNVESVHVLELPQSIGAYIATYREHCKVKKIWQGIIEEEIDFGDHDDELEVVE